jgi:hypothetical protein
MAMGISAPTHRFESNRDELIQQVLDVTSRAATPTLRSATA